MFCELAKSHKGVFRGISAEIVKAKPDCCPFLLPNKSYCSETVRCVNCEALVLLGKSRCSLCNMYRPTLRSLAKKKKKHDDGVATTSKTNWRYLSTPEKQGRFKQRVSEVRSFCVLM